MSKKDSDSLGFLFLNTSKDEKKFLRGTLEINGKKIKLVGFMGQNTDRNGKPYKGFTIREDIPLEPKETKSKKPVKVEDDF